MNRVWTNEWNKLNNCYSTTNIGNIILTITGWALKLFETPETLKWRENDNHSKLRIISKIFGKVLKLFQWNAFTIKYHKILQL